MRTIQITAMILILAMTLACGGGMDISAAKPIKHSVSLTWTEEVTGVVTYNVFRGTTAGGPYARVATVTTKAWTDTNIKEGTYYYVVDAVIGGQSYRSNELKATP